MFNQSQLPTSLSACTQGYGGGIKCFEKWLQMVNLNKLRKSGNIKQSRPNNNKASLLVFFFPVNHSHADLKDQAHWIQHILPILEPEPSTLILSSKALRLEERCK